MAPIKTLLAEPYLVTELTLVVQTVSYEKAFCVDEGLCFSKKFSVSISSFDLCSDDAALP